MQPPSGCEPLVQVYAGFDTNTRAGDISLVSDAVKALTGRAPATPNQFFAVNWQALLNGH